MNVLPHIDAPVAEDASWYKDAIIYQLHVKAFADSNEDGIGDFAGLTDKLDYLQELGVTTLWLLPFYPSPQRDDGYDIADYGSVHPSFGTMKDFRRFMAEAKRRNLRVITELVINHTSDQHPWFKRARRSPPGSSARDWYVWSSTDQKYLETRIIFTDTEKSNWSWDPEAGAYYWHRFFSHQPDLNFDNPRVVSAVVQAMKRWLDAGVDGFRLDAIPYLVERDGTNNENLPETHAVIKHIRAELDAYTSGKVLLAEANQWPEDVQQYFGDGDECHMAYHFPLMPRIYMAIAQEDRFPIADILRQTPDIPANCQWAMFLRNHDELTLEMVTDSERDYLWSTYASDPRMRINVGIRRRLAPLMDNDRRKIELMNSLLMSMPGTPIIYYGDEIGMGDNIYLGDRNGVRTPMQWTPDRNGGFSRADPAKLYAPVIMDPIYGYSGVNVEAQSRSISSLLSWMKRLIAVRKTSQAFGRGTLSFIRPANRSVLCYVREYGGETILCVANLSRNAQAAELDLSPWRGRHPQEMLGRTRFPAIGDSPFVVTLAPYGFFWFLLPEVTDPSEMAATPLELATLVVVKDGWGDLVRGRTRTIFEREVLPAVLPTRRWFADKGQRSFEARIQTAIELTHADPHFLWAVVALGGERGSRYSLPMRMEWDRLEHVRKAGGEAIAPLRRGPREGTLTDAAADRAFVTWLLAALHSGRTVRDGDAAIAFLPSRAFAQGEAPEIRDIKALSAEQSNTTVVANSAYVLKYFRRLQPGLNPDIEVTRFLTDVAGYRNTPPLIGSVELGEGETSAALAVVQGFVENQGDGWATTVAYLNRFLEDTKLLAQDVLSDPDQHSSILVRMRQLGRRVAELHVALASSDADEAFRPEPVTSADRERWQTELVERADRTFADVEGRRASLPEASWPMIENLQTHRGEALARARELLPADLPIVNIRHHGDLHLGQVLIVKDDFYIIDFEGEPERPMAARRRKAPAARDVAGLIRSIDYAATAALDRLVQTTPEERIRVEAALDVWRRQATEALLEGYREHATDQRLWPADPDAAQRLLDFFVLEKAIYEIGYELANRPTWLQVPLAGVLRLLVPAETTAQ